MDQSERDSQGVLIHCISGWDRTPLFISLLRILLWSDGILHSSLSADQLLFLTIAYDWMLFGHDAAFRKSQNAEILFYCFFVLDYLEEDCFSFQFSTNQSSAAQLENRKSKLKEISSRFFECYLPVVSPNGKN